MKKVSKVFIMLILVWVGVTFYFFTQHTLKGREAPINRTIELKDSTIELDKLVVVNFELKPTHFERIISRDNLATKLPQPLMMSYLRLNHVYSTPYHIDNKLYHTYLIGKCRFKMDTTEGTEYFSYFDDHIDINVEDSIGYGYSSSKSLRYEGNRNEIDLIIRGSGFPIERMKHGLKVTVKHLETGEEREIPVAFEDFRFYEYNTTFQQIESLSILH